MAFTPAAIPTREPKKLATTTITNELAVAFNQSLGLGQTGAAGTTLHRAVVMYAKITGVYNNRDGYYNAKSITQPKTLNVKSTTDLTETDLGVVSKSNDLILTNPSEVVTSTALATNDIVPFELIGETADGKGFGRILSVVSSGQTGLFPVQLTQTGGSAGTSSVQCSFTYTVKDITGTDTYGTSIGVTGNGQRIVNAAMTAGTYGMAYWHTDGTIRLLWADEKITQTNCT